MSSQGQHPSTVKPSERLRPFFKRWGGQLESLADFYIRSTRRHYAECAEFAEEMLDGSPTAGEFAAGMTQQMFKCYEFAWSLSLAPLKMCVGGPTTKVVFKLDSHSEATDPIAIDRGGHALATLSATDLCSTTDATKRIPAIHVRLTTRATEPDLLYVSLVDLGDIIAGLTVGDYQGQVLGPGSQVVAVLRARIS